MLVLFRLGDAMPGSTTNFRIRPKPCSVNALDGTCMFVWECIKSEGQHLGVCVDSFMFGSCCAHNLGANSVAPTSASVAGQHFDLKKPSKKPKPPAAAAAAAAATLGTNSTVNRPVPSSR